MRQIRFDHVRTILKNSFHCIKCNKKTSLFLYCTLSKRKVIKNREILSLSFHIKVKIVSIGVKMFLEWVSLKTKTKCWKMFIRICSQSKSNMMIQYLILAIVSSILTPLACKLVDLWIRYAKDNIINGKISYIVSSL